MGDGMADAQAILDRVEELTDLSVIAITDHDDIRGALEAREVHARRDYHFAFIPGIEITTRSGHLLGLWVENTIRSFRPLRETVAEIHRAGGLAIVPHPFSFLTRSVGQRALERVLAEGDSETRPDGIEVANSSLAGRVTRRKAQKLNRERYGLAETGGSDAHFPEEIGTSTTLFPGNSADDLRRAILECRTYGLFGNGPSLHSLGFMRLAKQQVRGLSVTPRKLLESSVERLSKAMRR